jgi:hypothetical protein
MLKAETPSRIGAPVLRFLGSEEPLELVVGYRGRALDAARVVWCFAETGVIRVLVGKPVVKVLVLECVLSKTLTVESAIEPDKT